MYVYVCMCVTSPTATTNGCCVMICDSQNCSTSFVRDNKEETSHREVKKERYSSFTIKKALLADIATSCHTRIQYMVNIVMLRSAEYVFYKSC